MNTLIKISTKLEDGTVLVEYVSQVEMEGDEPVWVKGSANRKVAHRFDVIRDRKQVDAIVNLILDGMVAPTQSFISFTFV